MNWKCWLGHYWAEDGLPLAYYELPDAPGYEREGWHQHCIRCGRRKMYWPQPPSLKAAE